MSRRSKPNPHIHIVYALIGLLVLGIASAATTFWYFSQPPQPQNSTPITFTIKSGESIDQISQKLSDLGLIRYHLVFKLNLKRLGLSSQIQAGNFALAPNLSNTQLARALTRAAADQIQITLIEGWRREQMAAALATAFSPNQNFSQAEFLSLTSNLEGQLFPDTYNFSPQASTDQVVSTLTTNFATKVLKPFSSQINASPYNLNQLLTMASIIEREARGSARPVVAGILWRRYQNDWPLQADATLQYAKGYNSYTNDWWSPPLAQDKEFSSPFNTYQNPGLPPAPICNPSLDSFTATLNPQSTNYWYYITDNQGNMHYATTYDQHLQNINTYLK